MGLGWKEKIRLLFLYFRREDAELRNFAIGMSSEVNIKKDMHILFLDYDQAELSDVEESVRECQEFWHLSDCFIYKTRNGYHAYFFYDIMPYSRVLMILNYAKYVDDMFRFIGRYYDYKTIRQAGKYKKPDISFITTIRGPRMPTEQELELGDLKRKERGYLSQMGNMLQKDKLKD